VDRLRVDKWLWAARFFKTRSIAKTAIEGGKVHLEGQRVKVSREISVGEVLVIKQGWDEKEVVVRALSAQRGPAPIARELYEETANSIEKREREAQARKAAGGAVARPAQKPGKHQRKALERLRKQFDI
jgi:ribosome-associated heat shock protein Hsp15|tara:strand:+ start:543 stop:929 length:387 start_codon:yes stop_codon:yes gene_type:complete